MLAPFLFATLLDDARPTMQELRSTVTVTGPCVRDCVGGGQMTLGAGEIVGRQPDGGLVVLTARHVVESIATPRVYVRNGARSGIDFAAFARESSARSATVLAYANNVDLALVVFRPQGSDDYDFAPLAAVGAQGEPGVVVGDPYGLLWTVSRFTYLQTTPDALLLDCVTCGPGDSGGGVFDTGGRLIGILVQQRVEGNDGEQARRTSQYLAVSLSELRLFLDTTQAKQPGPPRLSDAWIRFESMRAVR